MSKLDNPAILDTDALVSGFTQGSILFVDANGTLQEDNSNLFWDDTNDRLGVGTAGPITDFELELSVDGADGLSLTGASGSTVSARLFFKPGSGEQFGLVADSSGLNFLSDVTVGTSTGTSRMLMDGDGHFRITTSDARGLNLKGGSGSTSGRLFFEPSTGEQFALLVDSNGLTFTSDATAGTSSGTARAVMDGDGKWGINETSPDAMLEIVAASATDNVLHIKGAVSQSADLARWTDSSDTDLVVIDSAGKLGVGASPTRTLTIHGTTSSISSFNIDAGEQAYFGTGASVISGGATNELGFASDIVSFASKGGVRRLTINSSIIYLYNDSDTGFTHPGANIIGFNTGGSERMRIDGSGNVGIGVTPTSGLHINKSLAYQRTATAGSMTTSGDTIIGMTGTTGATITLASADAVEGRIIIVKDEGGNAGGLGDSITIDTEGSETIDGSASITINTDFGFRALYCNGTDWHLIGLNGTL